MDDSKKTVRTAAEYLFCQKQLRDVLHWLACLGVPESDRDDVAGQVWLAAWRSLPTFDPRRARPERWLNRIAVHIASHYHERAHLRREELTDKPIELVDFTPDASAMLAAISIKVDVIEAIQELDPALRSLIISHDLEGIPMVDLAEAEGLPLSTLYKRRAKALAALRDALERREAEETRLAQRHPHRS